MESSEKPGRAFERQPNIEDYYDAPFYHLLLQFPEELSRRYIKEIELKNLDDTQTFELLENAAAARKEALTVSLISDKEAYEVFSGQEEEVFHDIETDVYRDPARSVGSGTTARVKRYDISNEHTTLPMAIKYVVTPNPETVTAAEEHNIVHEAERIQEIEALEKDAALHLFKLPHPYFHHRTEHIQCYGMQLIEGATLEDISYNELSPERAEAIRNALNEVSLDALNKEIDTFFERMHTRYLHRDIKSGNIMVDKDGTFYLIDFGNAVPISSLSEQALSTLEDDKHKEVRTTKESVANFWNNFVHKEYR